MTALQGEWASEATRGSLDFNPEDMLQSLRGKVLSVNPKELPFPKS